LHRYIWLRFRVIDSRIRRGIYYYVRTSFPNGALYGARIAKIELAAIGCHDIAQGGQRSPEFPAHLSFLASDKDSQGNASARRSGMPR